MDDWEVNPNGQIKWKAESDEHTLYAIDGKGKRIEGKSLTLQNRNILDQLSASKGKREMLDAEGYAYKKGERREAVEGEKSGDEMASTFLFLANNTNVEWNISFAKEDGGEYKYGISTDGFDNSVGGIFSGNELITNIHSHPRPGNSIKDETESMAGDRNNAQRSKYTYSNYVYMQTSTRL